MAAGRSKKRIPHPRAVVPQPPFTTIDEAVADIAKGRMVIVVDDEDRENEGDLTMAAESVTAEDVAFIRKYASGVICVPMTADRHTRWSSLGPPRRPQGSVTTCIEARCMTDLTRAF